MWRCQLLVAEMEIEVAQVDVRYADDGDRPPFAVDGGERREALGLLQVVEPIGAGRRQPVCGSVAARRSAGRLDTSDASSGARAPRRASSGGKVGAAMPRFAILAILVAHERKPRTEGGLDGADGATDAQSLGVPCAHREAGVDRRRAGRGGRRSRRSCRSAG